MKRYVVAYLNRHGRADWPKSRTIEAENAKDARRLFNEWYWSRSDDRLTYPFHITVKRFDGLTRCPLCGSLLEEKNDPEMGYVCTHLRCGLQIKRKAQ